MQNRPLRTIRCIHTALAASWALLVCGCGGKTEPRLIDYLDQLEFDVPLETATYVTLGRFDIPIVADKTPEEPSAHAIDGYDDHVWMRVQFELTAETSPRWKDAIAAAAEHHQGALSDAVLTVVRTSQIGDLADPRLHAVNARLTDILRPILGEDRVRRLMFTKLDQAAMEAASKHNGEHGGDDAEAEHGSHGAEHEETEQAHGGGHH